MVVKLDLILLSGGKGERAELGYDKGLFLLKNSDTLLEYMIKKYRNIVGIDKIIIVIPGFYEKITSVDNSIMILGGDTRQKSVLYGLKQVKSERVLITEVVRPFTTDEFIIQLLNTQGEYIVPFTTPSQTIWHRDLPVNRNNIKEIQLPQIFDTKKLLFAHEMAKSKGLQYTDDSSLYYFQYFIQPTWVEGLRGNIKLTYYEDFERKDVDKL